MPVNPAQRTSRFYDLASGPQLPHSPLNAIIAPRPIGWMSTRSTGGVLNLAPYSFFNAFHYTPPLIGFASNGAKDTVKNAEETQEFCWNLVSRDLAEAMNTTSAAVPEGVDEFELAGLTPARSRIVDVPHVAEAKVVFECRTTQVVSLQDAAGRHTGTRMAFGEVVGLHIEDDLLLDGVYQTARADPVLRAGGPTAYFTIREEDRFDLRRPEPEDVL